MLFHKKLARRRWLRLGLLAWFALPGCVADGWWGGRCEDIPKGAIPVCTGTHTKEIFQAQAAIAEADDFVLYEHQWLYDPVTNCRTAKPGPFGLYCLTQMVKRLPEVPFPVLIQVNPLNEKLNEDRRTFVVEFLVANGIPRPDAEARVLIGYPQAEGLFGEEAPVIYYQGFVNHTGTSGNPYYGNRGIYGGYGVSDGFNTLGGFGGFGSIYGGFGGLGLGGGFRRF
jgi:hypothetical protein